MAVITAALVVRAVQGQNAHADAHEASVHAELVLGRAYVKDGEHKPLIDVVPLQGLNLRGTYGLRDNLALECHIGVERTFEQIQSKFQDDDTLRVHRESWTHAAVTARWRGGVVWIPTAAIGLGAHVHHRDTREGIEAFRSFAIVPTVTLGLGVDYRASDALVVGVEFTARQAIPAEGRSINLLVHVGRNWYPFQD